MKRVWIAGLMLVVSVSAFAQVAPTAHDDHDAMLASHDPQLAANKRLVYDWWREIFEAGHLELAEQYMAADFIEHNPNVPTGRDGFVEFFSRVGEGPRPIQDRIQQELITIMAEDDLVTLMFVMEYDHPVEPNQKYKTTWYDTFRVEDGKVTEHWDPATIEAP